MKSNRTAIAGFAGTIAIVGALWGCAQLPTATWSSVADDASFAEMVRTGFRDAGPVKVDRLKQDETQAFCSDPVAAQSAANVRKAEAIEAANLATVKFPTDGKWLGDWRAGERLAQSGRGLTWTDAPNQPNGGNCYNCHQISAAEISFGTIGPSLYQYGKLRGGSDEVLRATWTKIYNSKASVACSNMPRAGHMGIIQQKDIQDLMALLLSPDSPVNK
jgi:sulfur-oxidizing protein SoxX